MAENYDFQGLNERLLSHGIDLLHLWLPGGKKHGREYVCAGLTGGKGESLSVNIRTGAWAEFNGLGAKGGDLISLYAAIHGITQGEAYRKLGGDLQAPAPRPAPIPEPVRNVLGTPPAGKRPDTSGAEATWDYLDPNGNLLFVIARYPGKRIRPWSWDIQQRTWVQKGWPAPRPLYGLDLLADNPDKPVLIVEGEKACDAARQLTSAYVCVTWPNGASAVDAVDWSPLVGRKILIWPDSDEPGLAARDKIIAALRSSVPEIKYLNVEGLPKGFDAADWDEPGTWSEWARPRVVLSADAEIVAASLPAAAADTSVAVTLVEDHAPIPESIAVLADTYGLATKGRSGMPVSNVENAARALAVIPGYQGICWWDEFYECVRTNLPPNWLSHDIKAPRMAGTGRDRDWTDADTLGLTLRFQRTLGFQTLSSTMLLESITLAAHADRRNAPRDWMRSLKWDGVKRLDSWTEKCFGLFYTHYNSAVGRNFFLSMVARTMRPGCQADCMVVLEGKQGVGKSSLFNIIAGPEWYAEATESPNNKDFFQVLRGKLIIEVAELDAFNRADVTRIKQILSCRSDRYRESYGRLAMDHPRRSIFVGTTNENNYLRDNTGARRFWPLEAKTLDLEWMRTHREQIFAEAVVAFDEGATWWEVPADEAKVQAEARRAGDEWEHQIAEWANSRPDGFTTRDVAVDCFGFSPKEIDKPMQFRIGHCLRALGYASKVGRVGGYPARVWIQD